MIRSAVNYGGSVPINLRALASSEGAESTRGTTAPVVYSSCRRFPPSMSGKSSLGGKPISKYPIIISSQL